MSSGSVDPVIAQYREQIADNDLRILEALNKRIKLVEKLKEYKESKGLDFVDQAQEDWLFTYLSRSNGGPLGTDGVREIFTAILSVMKREIVARQNAAAE